MNTYGDNVRCQLTLSNVDFKDKIILDIGCRDGVNCDTIAKMGAKYVIGIDIDDAQFPNESCFSSNVILEKHDLFEYNTDDKFDIITCFLWNFRLLDYDRVMEKIKSLIKSSGIILIGIHDDLYKYGYVCNGIQIPKTGSVIELVQKHFNSYCVLNRFDAHQWIIKINM